MLCFEHEESCMIWDNGKITKIFDQARCSFTHFWGFRRCWTIIHNFSKKKNDWKLEGFIDWCFLIEPQQEPSEFLSPPLRFSSRFSQYCLPFYFATFVSPIISLIPSHPQNSRSQRNRDETGRDFWKETEYRQIMEWGKILELGNSRRIDDVWNIS